MMQADGVRSAEDSQSWLRFLNEGTQLNLAALLEWLVRGKICVVPGNRDMVCKRFGTCDGQNCSLN